MINLRCTHCSKVLEIDEAFAGGVARCQFCGTIQTVPAKAAAAGKTLMREGQLGSTSGLDDLADVVSSGMSSGLRTKRSKPAPKEEAAPSRINRGRVMLWVGVAVMSVLILASGAWLIFSSGTPAQTAPPADTPAGLTGPRFLAEPLRGRSIAFVIDRGEATRPFLGLVADAVVKSADTLPAEARVEVFFWSEALSDVQGLTPLTTRTASTLSELRSGIADVRAGGRTDAAAALKKALATNVETVVLITAKGWQMDDEAVDKAVEAWAGSGARLITVNLGSVESQALQELATRLGGRYVSYDTAQLRERVK